MQQIQQMFEKMYEEKRKNEEQASFGIPQGRRHFNRLLLKYCSSSCWGYLVVSINVITSCTASSIVLGSLFNSICILALSFPIYRVQFNRRNQKTGETVEIYATELKRNYEKAYTNRDARIRQEDLLQRSKISSCSLKSGQ
jgi:hypothetical protein